MGSVTRVRHGRRGAAQRGLILLDLRGAIPLREGAAAVLPGGRGAGCVRAGERVGAVRFRCAAERRGGRTPGGGQPTVRSGVGTHRAVPRPRHDQLLRRALAPGLLHGALRGWNGGVESREGNDDTAVIVMRVRCTYSCSCRRYRYASTRCGACRGQPEQELERKRHVGKQATRQRQSFRGRFWCRHCCKYVPEHGPRAPSRGT